MLSWENKDWSDFKDRFSNPSYILITYYSFDMFEKGFYEIASDDEGKGFNSHLRDTRTPKLVIKNDLNEVLYLDSFNCGYSGTGPYRSMELLKDCNIPIEFIEKIETHQVFELTRGSLNNYKFTGTKKSRFSNEFFYKLPYYKDNKLIFVNPEPRIDSIALTTSSIKHNIAFSKEYLLLFSSPATSITIIPTREEAIEQGYYRDNFIGRSTVYQFIIKSCDKEIWLNPPIIPDKSSLLFEDSVIELLGGLGIKLEYAPTYKNDLVEWLRKNVLKKSSTTIEISLD
ncbi:ABC transporter permease protein [Bacillus sp. TS-2]|nr:ABC transporter permease protein [Bacillus sp. TS-2]